MLCPYRIATLTTIHKVDFTASVAKEERMVFEDCDGEKCPFYDSSTEECLRVQTEIGGAV